MIVLVLEKPIAPSGCCSRQAHRFFREILEPVRHFPEGRRISCHLVPDTVKCVMKGGIETFGLTTAPIACFRSPAQAHECNLDNGVCGGWHPWFPGRDDVGEGKRGYGRSEELLPPRPILRPAGNCECRNRKNTECLLLTKGEHHGSLRCQQPEGKGLQKIQFDNCTGMT